MAYAIIKTGGKQYRVAVGDTLDIEKLELAEGETATFDQVLAHGEGDSITVGSPTISGATVQGKVVSQYRGEKLIIFKFRRRKGFHKKKGHRQSITKVEITAINA
jgi:large subunit ribosomal protein L21